MPVGSPAWQTQSLSGFTERHPTEKPELHDFRSDRVVLPQVIESIIEFEQIVVGGSGQASESIDIDPVPTTTTLQPVPIPSVVRARIRRIASAAAAKKCPRPSKC